MAVRDAGTRQDTFALRVTLNGVSLGIWDKKTGGDLDSEATLYNPGAMMTQLNLGGRKTSANVSVQRLYDRFDDHDKINTLLAAVGHGAVSIAQRPMDEDGNEYGKSIIWNGTLKRVLIPDVDSESTTAAQVEIEVVVKGYPVAI
jgi:hypothetical protein